MTPERKLFILAALCAGVGFLLVGGSAWAAPIQHISLPIQTAPPDWTCDSASTVPCSCVKRQDNTFCYDPSQTVMLIWCIAQGGDRGPCVAGSTVQCPSDGAAVVVGGTTCTDSTPTTFICSGVNVTSC